MYIHIVLEALKDLGSNRGQRNIKELFEELQDFLNDARLQGKRIEYRLKQLNLQNELKYFLRSMWDAMDS